ncbi:MAG: serine protease [Clostridia bacterium]|nr:serine protease [Clostridia bacterium]
MKKRSLVSILLILSIVLILSLTACSGLFGNSNPSRYYIDIGQVEDAGVASIVANNSIASCVRVIAEFKRNNKVVSTSASSGFVITEDGYVLTNRHCVIRYYSTDSDTPSSSADTPMSANYSVVFADNIQYTATLVDWCTTADIAVLRIDKVSNFPLTSEKTYEPLVFETQQELYYGQRVYTIGNPENMGLMLSEMMIAMPLVRFRKKDENDNVIEDAFLSTVLDGNINHGNSGGPLINVYSRVCGIVYARIDGTKNDVYGIGCSIPTSEIISFLDSMSVKINYKTTPVSSGKAE